jgi:hypothetical protein
VSFASRPSLLHQAVDAISARAAALLTFDPQHVELSDQVAASRKDSDAEQGELLAKAIERRISGKDAPKPAQ